MKRLCFNNRGHFAGFLGEPTGSYTVDGIPIRVGDVVHVMKGNNVNEHVNVVFMSNNHYGVFGSASSSIEKLTVSGIHDSYKSIERDMKVGDTFKDTFLTLEEFYTPEEK